MDIHQNLLQSEVLSFFSPVTTDVNSLGEYPVAPKCDIFEPAAPKSKTITVKCEKLEESTNRPLSNMPDVHTDVNGVYRLERLDSSVNPDITAKLDRMAQKLGFQVPARSGGRNRNGNSDCEDLQLDEVDLVDPRISTEPNSFRNKTSSPEKSNPISAPKRSLFTSLMKRLSSRPKYNSPGARSKSEDGRENRPHLITVGSGPSGIRRWFSKRLWRQKNAERKETEPSETSMASAGAVLEGSLNVSSTDQLVSPTSHSQVRNPDSHACYSAGPKREFLSLEQLSPLDSASCRPNKVEIAAYKCYPACPTSATPLSAAQIKAQTLNYSSTTEATGFCPPIAVSFSQNSLLECRSSRTNVADVPVTLNGGSFLSRQACGSEGTALHKTHRAPIQATSILPNSYTPSYVSVSVAAFGYSGYGRTSLSSGNLHSTRLEKPKGLPVPVRSVPHSSSSHNGDLPAAFNPTANLPENQTVMSQRSREELQRSPLHVDVTESTNENVQSSVGVQNGILESKLNGYNTTNERPIESPRLPIRPNSRSPCPSPGRDMYDSASGTVQMRRSRTRSQTGNSEDQVHWHRSSLIMLAVAHASPRGRMTTSIGSPETSLLFHHGDGEDTAAAMATGDPGHASLTHSFRESIMEEPNEDTKILCPTTSPQAQLNSEKTTIEPSDTIDGNYFLRLTEQVQSEIRIQIERTEADLKSTPTINEEVAGLMRTAVGKAKLLLSEKFVQFRNLCQQNLDWSASQQNNGNLVQTVKTDCPDLVTLVSDLDGFWAMVMLQVDDVRAQFRKVDELRENGWQLPSDKDKAERDTLANGDGLSLELNKTPVARSGVRKQTPGPKSASRFRDDSAARAKARERLAMAKREMRAKQMEAISASKTTGDDVFIIV
ncbi:hypothetical protein FBUS_05379 [Fasciolopsis buskii]|uniref:Disks large-associated protein 1 n=1 Tax=Fasciolopsis buskii TaxID=27845 RepID=A0A8E0RNB9_9TREM|nr:hypothetical protein FBUS_05379 [Fasciolopsis buski]